MGWDQVGTKEFIQGVKQEDFIRYRNSLYMPDNVVIAVAGKVDHKDVVSKIEEYFAFTNGKKSFHWKSLVANDSKKRISLTHKKTEQAHLVLGFPAYPEQHPDHFVAKLLAVALGGNMSSRMFQSVREAKGLAYYISTATDDYHDVGVFSTRAGVDLKGIDQAIQSIIAEYKKICEEKVLRDELNKAQEFIKGKMTLRLEDSEEYAHLLGKQELLANKIMSFQEVCGAIDKVTADDIVRVSQDLFVPDKMYLAVIGPFEDEQRFEGLMVKR